MTRCRLSRKSVSFLSDRRRFSAFLQSFALSPEVSSLTEQDVQVNEKESRSPVHGGNSIFEPLSEEYFEKEETNVTSPIPGIDSAPTLASRATPTGAHVRWDNSHRVMRRKTGLPELVSSGDFARAESLRVELVESNIHIKRHLVYAQAALHAWNSKPVEERTEAFYKWFSLIPNASLGRIRRARETLYEVRRKLFSEPTDLNTIACFGLVASRKGFANFASVNVIAHIARFASPGVSSAFFDACEKSAVAFYSRFHGKTKEDSSFSVWDTEKYHNSFVRALCFAGYVDAAVDRLSHVLDKAVPIAPFTWIILLENLTELGRDDLIAVVRKLRATATRGTLSPSPKPARDLPSTTYLSRMMAHCIESGNTQDLYRLRDEMVETGLSPDLWVTAQMKYYQDMGQHTVVLRQFLSYYMSTGVPKEYILRYVHEDSKWYRPSSDKVLPTLPLIRPLPRFQGQRRWPSTHTLTMVLKSLLSFVEDIQGLSALYRSCLDYWDRYCPIASSEPVQLPSKHLWTDIQFRYPPVMKPDTVHYQAFVVAFARLSGVDAAMQVLVDMHTRGIRPDAHNWTVIAGEYAAQGDMANAERILTRMEDRLKDDAVPAASPMRKDAPRTLVGPAARSTGWIPEPTLATYTTILRGLIDQRRYGEAKQFEKRMNAAGYIPGSDQQTEMVLDLLRRRDATPRTPWQQRLHWQPGSSKK